MRWVIDEPNSANRWEKKLGYMTGESAAGRVGGREQNERKTKRKARGSGLDPSADPDSGARVMGAPMSVVLCTTWKGGREEKTVIYVKRDKQVEEKYPKETLQHYDFHVGSPPWY